MWGEQRLLLSITREQVKNSPAMDTHKPVSRQHEAEPGSLRLPVLRRRSRQLVRRRSGCHRHMSVAARKEVRSSLDQGSAGGHTLEQRLRRSIDVSHTRQIDGELQLGHRQSRRARVLESSPVARTQAAADGHDRDRMSLHRADSGHGRVHSKPHALSGRGFSPGHQGVLVQPARPDVRVDGHAGSLVHPDVAATEKKMRTHRGRSRPSST